MYKAIILPDAKEDIKEAAFWYNGMQKGLGKRFTQDVRYKIDYICEYPKSLAVRYDNTRCVMMNGQNHISNAHVNCSITYCIFRFFLS